MWNEEKTKPQEGYETLAAKRLLSWQFRTLGFLPLMFFLGQAIHYWQINQLGHMLWMCNIGNLLLALGLFFAEAELIRVAVIWMVPGVLVWFVYVVPTWGILLRGQFRYPELFGVLSSTLAHLGGFAVGIVVLRRVGISSYWRFWLVLTILIGVGLWMLGFLLKKLWPVAPSMIESGAP